MIIILEKLKKFYQNYSSVIILFICLLFANEVRAEVCFSPAKIKKESCQSLIINNIKKAEKTIDFAIYSFTDINIADALIFKKNDIKIRCIYDKVQSKQKNSLIEYLNINGINCKVKTGRGIMHHKYIIIDNKFLITGSYNWTNNARENNNENAILFGEDYIVRYFIENFNELWNIY